MVPTPKRKVIFFSPDLSLEFDCVVCGKTSSFALWDVNEKNVRNPVEVSAVVAFFFGTAWKLVEG